MTQNPNQTRVLVTGANGAVGPRVVQALYDQEYHIRVLSLSGCSCDALPTGIEVVTGDITKVKDLRIAVHGCDAVVHLAALLHVVDPPDSLRPKYAQVNVGGTQNVVEAAIQAGVRRLVFFSTINVYGNTGSQIVNEEFEPIPQTYYAETKLAAENIVLNAKTGEGKHLGVVFRLGAVYGGRIKGNYSQLVESIERGRFLPIGAGANRRTLVYDKDVARATVLALRHPAAPGQIYNVTDGSYHTVSEIITAICAALGKPPPRFSIPVVPVRLLAGMTEDFAKCFGRRSPLTRSAVDKYTEDIAVDGSRIQRELGFQPQYDLMQGWREAISDMKAAQQ